MYNSLIKIHKPIYLKYLKISKCSITCGRECNRVEKKGRKEEWKERVKKRNVITTGGGMIMKFTF